MRISHTDLIPKTITAITSNIEQVHRSIIVDSHKYIVSLAHLEEMARIERIEHIASMLNDTY